MDFDTLNSPAATAQNWEAVDDIILNGERGAASAAGHDTELARQEPTYEELMQELRRLIPDNSPELQNVRAARFASMSYGEGNREASIEAARKANRNLANSGVDNISATGNMWEYWDNRARAVMNNPDATAEQLQLRGKQIEAFARYCQTSPDSPYRNWPEEAKRTFMQWASQTVRHLDDMAEIRRGQPDDTGLWNEAWRAYRRFGIQNDLAIAGLGRLVTGGKWEAANEMYRDYSRLLEMPEVIPSREATRAWYTPNALTATFTEGTLSMMESVATAYVGGQLGAAAAGLGKGAKAAAEAGALASRLQKGAYFGHTIGWTVPFGIEAAGNKFNEAWEYNRVHHPEWTERESYWNAAGQAATAAAIEIGSEYCGAMWGVGRLQAERLYGRLANRALKGQAERLVLRTAKESGRQWLGRLAKAGAGSFAEEWGEEVAADVANQFVADPLWKGDSELFREYRRNGLDGMWAAFSVMMVQNAIAVSTTCLSGAYHAATGYRLTGAADWYSTPVQAAAHYGIVDARPASLTAAGIQSLLEGNRQRAQQAAKELDGLDEGRYGRQGRIGAQLIGELMGYSAGVRELLDAARDTAMFRDKKGTVTVDVFQPASDRGDCFVTISEGDEIRGIALAQDGEEAAFLQELVLSEVTGKVSQYLVDLSQLPQAGQMSATYAYRREDGTWVARTRAGAVAIDSAKNTSFLPAGVRDAIESALDDRKVEPLPKPMQCMGLLRPANASPAEEPGKDNAGEGAATLRDRPEQVSAAEAVENRNNALSALVKEAQERYRELTLDQAKKRLRELDAQISGLQATEEEAAERSALVSIIDELEDPSTLEDVEDSIREADKGATAVVDGTADEETMRRWSVPTWLRELSEGDGSLDGQAFERLPAAMEQHLAAAMQDTRFAEATSPELSAFRQAVEDKDKKGTVEHGNRLLDAFIAWEDELKRSNARDDGTVSQATSDVRDSALKAMLEQA
ncbi:MAG: hypothetical protein IJJ33_04390, partial [Victivallales bacterium]|nr:hypothetical protein [Victivallales bacterium]